MGGSPFPLLIQYFNIVDTAGEEALQGESNDKGNIDRISTRAWAQSCDYDPEKLFTKLFHDDIKYLLSMDNLWKKRRSPTPLKWRELPDGGLLLSYTNIFFPIFSTKIMSKNNSQRKK